MKKRIFAALLVVLILVCNLSVSFAAPAENAPAQPSAGAAVVTAPVAGTYLKGMFSEGASVKAGDTVCMIESMKMELEVKASSNGTIHYIATAGSAITAGQPLAEIK